MRTPREAGVFVHRDGRLLVLHRREDGYWHIVAGVVEPAETFVAAAARELLEETGLAAVLLDLDLPLVHPVTTELRERYDYPHDVHEVTVHSFAAKAPSGWEPTLNEEHDEYRWCTVDEAVALFHWPEARQAARILADRLGIAYRMR